MTTALSTGHSHFLLLRLMRIGQLRSGSPTPWTAFENVTVMEETIQHCRHGGRVAQQLAPVFDGTIRGQKSARAFVAPHHDLEQFLCRRWGKFAHAQIVDNEQWHGRQEFHVLFARPVDRVLCQPRSENCPGLPIFFGEADGLQEPSFHSTIQLDGRCCGAPDRSMIPSSTLCARRAS